MPPPPEGEDSQPLIPKNEAGTPSTGGPTVGLSSTPPSTWSYWRVGLVFTMHAVLVGIFVFLISLRYRHRNQPISIRSPHGITGLLVDKAVVSVNSIFKVQVPVRCGPCAFLILAV